MLLRHNKNQSDQEGQYMPLRLLGIFTFIVFITIFCLNSYFLYNQIYARRADIAELELLQSQGLPHVVHFDRLEKIEASWKEKQNISLPVEMRNPFESGVPIKSNAIEIRR